MPVVARREDLLSRVEAAAYLGVKVSWLAQHTPQRGGPAMVKLGAKPYYLKEDLDVYITEARRERCEEGEGAPGPCSTGEAATGHGGATSTLGGAAFGGPRARAIAEKLRRASTSSTPPPKQRLVALDGLKE